MLVIIRSRVFEGEALGGWGLFPNRLDEYCALYIYNFIYIIIIIKSSLNKIQN